MSESISIAIIIAIIAVLAGASLFHLDNPLNLSAGQPNELLAFFGHGDVLIRCFL